MHTSLPPNRRKTPRDTAQERTSEADQIRREAWSVYNSGGECCGASKSSREFAGYEPAWGDARTSVTTIAGALVLGSKLESNLPALRRTCKREKGRKILW